MRKTRKTSLLLLSMAILAACGAEDPPTDRSAGRITSALTSGIPLAAAPGHFETSAIAASGDEYLVAYIDRGSSTLPGPLRATRVTGDGAVLDPAGIPLPTTAASNIAVAASPSLFLVVWANYHGGLYAARVTRDGTVLDPSAIAIVGTITFDFPSTPQVSWDGHQFMVTYYLANQVRLTRIRADGTNLDGAGIVLATGDSPGPLASDRGRTLVTFFNNGYRVLRSDLTVLASHPYPVAGEYPLNALFDGHAFAVLLADAAPPSHVDLVRLGPGYAPTPSVTVASGAPVFNWIFVPGRCELAPRGHGKPPLWRQGVHLAGWQTDFTADTWRAAWLLPSGAPRASSALPAETYAAGASNGRTFLLSYWADFHLQGVLLRPLE
ncbi:MAG TPA: hypothetical protein VH877_33555 [Polyangia bacterium]|nr:hypothetical protein [Polyangia bacterium]